MQAIPAPTTNKLATPYSRSAGLVARSCEAQPLPTKRIDEETLRTFAKISSHEHAELFTAKSAADAFRNVLA